MHQHTIYTIRIPLFDEAQQLKLTKGHLTSTVQGLFLYAYNITIVPYEKR